MRTVLYANREVSDYLRENYVLLWSSERPVPRATIDFGDGRVIERTLTGNAVHYVLDAQGRPLDAIPGLYGPGAFIHALHQGCETHAALDGFSDELRPRVLRERHAVLARRNELNLERYREGARRRWPVAQNNRPPAETPTAREAAASAMSKSGIELRAIDSVTASAGTDDVDWRRIAQLRAHDSRLDRRSLLLMSRELGQGLSEGESVTRVMQRMEAVAAPRAVERARSKHQGGQGALVSLLTSSERELARLAGNFQESLAQDSVRNEHDFHLQIHRWFAEGEVGDSLDELNERVYREIFLTPRSDPWLGLGAQESYTGIAGGGRR